jgi:cytosine/adenosine deaminase-related metal-dependent hydrolase
MIIRARVVVTMAGPPIANGAVAIAGERIVGVGPLAEIRKRHGGEEIDLGEHALLPGLLNAHCHLDYTCLRGKIAPQKTFTDWIRAINMEKSRLAEEDYLRSINHGFLEAKRFGTTALANLEAFPDLVRKVHEPLRTWWFAELIDFRTPESAKEGAGHAFDSLGAAEHRGLAPHAPFTASKNLYRCCSELARGNEVFLTTHVAESEEEMAMFRDRSGALCEFMEEIGRDMTDCGQGTPLSHFMKSALPGEPWLVAHLNELAGGDWELLAGPKLNVHIVHCPRSHRYFRHSPFQFERLRRLGFNISLGTDSLASNDDLSLFAEMREFSKTFPEASLEEILAMVTRNPATALGEADSLGRIGPNCLADLIAVPFVGPEKTVYEEIISFAGSVPWTMLGGKAAET